MNIFVRLFLILLCGLAAALPAAAQAPERRVALVIGNEAYKYLNELSNPAHDAALIGASVKAAGFELVGGRPLINADKKSIEAAIRSFGQKLQGGAVALFYYSGHGVQIGEHNYIVPVDASIRGASDVDFEMVPVDLLVKQITNGGGRLNMVILDACRTNPLAGRTRASGGGLAAMEAPQGTIISYATAPGKTAADGEEGTNSPYATALAQAMRRPGLSVLDMFNEVGVAVEQATKGEQQPWLAISPLRGRFSFIPEGTVPGPAQVAAAPAAPAPLSTPQPAPPPPSAPAAAPTPAGSLSQLVAQAAHGTSPTVSVADLLKRADAADDAKDYAQAFSLYRAAADQGSARGQFNVGYYYRKGLSMRASPAEAARWYALAAEQGYASAQNNLGFLYSEGTGVSQDYARARQLYAAAAEQGDATAQSNLASMYLNGRGGPKDHAKARQWFKKAAAQGDKTAISALADMDAD